HLSDSFFDTVESVLNGTDGRPHSRKILEAQVQIQRLPVSFGCSFQIVGLLGHAIKLPGIPCESIAAKPIPVGELDRLALAGSVAVAFCLTERVGAAIKILQTINESPGQPEKRIRPTGPQLRSLAKGSDGFGQITFGFRELASGSFRFPIDPV